MKNVKWQMENETQLHLVHHKLMLRPLMHHLERRLHPRDNEKSRAIDPAFLCATTRKLTNSAPLGGES